MKKNVPLLCCSALLLLLGSGCAAPVGQEDNAPVVIEADFSGGGPASETRSVPRGSIVEIRLKANATTGYSWQFTQSGELDAAVLEKHVYSTPESNRELCGAPGVDVWRFRAAKKGRANLNFRYYRRWEKFSPGHDAERVFTIVVTD